MATVAELLVKIGGDSSGLRKEIAASQRQLKRGFGAEALELSGNAAGLLAGLAAAAGIAGAAAVKMSADFAASKTAFTTLLGSGEAAEKMLSDLATFAADTPFEFAGLTKSAQKLMAFQFAAEDIIPIMSSVGNAIALVGGGQEAIDGVVRALGQIQAKGKLSAEEMNQLSERGINGWKYIADAMGISVAEVMDLSQKGAIDATTAINAVVTGMQTNFAGGMDAMSKTVPGLLSTIKDNASMVMKEIGDAITESFNLQGVLTNVANWLTQFAAVVKGAGVKEAIQGLVPPEAVASIFALSGAIVGAAYPALEMLALGAARALLPLLPYIAVGAAIAAVAYEIWNNWEPLSELFSTLWDTIATLFTDYWNVIAEVCGTSVDAVLGFVSSGWNAVGEATDSVWSGITGFIGEAWQSIKQIVADGIAWIVGKMQPLLDLIGKAMPEGVKTMFSNLAAGIGKVGAAMGKFHLGGIDVSGITGQSGSKPNTTFSGLHGTSASGGTTAGGSGSGAADKEAKAMEKLAEKAEQTSKRIKKEWIQLTGTKMDALDAWYADEVEKLDESASANEDYERDVQRLSDIYAEKRRKIMQQEEQDKLDSFKKIADAWLSTQKTLTLGSMTGSEKETTSMAFDTLEKIKSASAQYDQIATDYANGTEQQKSNILSALDQVGIAYVKTAEDTLNFDMAKSAETNAYKKQLMQDYTDYYASCKDIQSDIDAAYNANSMAMLQAALTEQNAVRMNDYTAQQEMMNVWQEAMLAAHATTAQLMAGLYSSAFGGLQTAFSDILTGAKSIGEAFQGLGKTLLKVVADWVAKWIAGRIMMSVMGKTTLAAETAASVAAGATVAAAWSKAAAMVSLASFGANAGPAMAGISATTALAVGLAGVPQLAAGGLATGPSLAVIGEGRYKEAVLPLNDKVFGKIADGINGSGGGGTVVTQNVYGDINTEADYDRMYNDLGGAIASAMRGA